MANTTHYEMKAKGSETIMLVGSFTTNGTGVPDGATGDISSVTRSDVGDYSVTLRHAYPQCDFSDASVLGNDPTLDAKVTSVANIASGTVLVTCYTEDGTTGISAAADSTDKVVQILLVVRNTKLTTR